MRRRDASMTAYRPDIDGLRAVAVIPVALFHAEIAGFDGGFVGVDVFFVISGFLITSILIQDVDRGSFSIVRFYERRVRRLLPALTVVVAACVAFAYWLFLPRALQDFGQSVAACALFVANLLFFREVGYFDAPHDLKPLLHTWSLAVEEQFYLFFPLLLIAIRRHLRGRYAAALLALVVASFASSVWMMDVRESAAFYLIPFRAWELGIGALLAIGFVPPPRSAVQADAAGLLGLGAILGAVFFYARDISFPGWAALPPCIGTALVIHAGADPRSWVARLLALRPLVFVGLVSYSFYLWHWPALVFARYYNIEELCVATRLGIVAAALGLAVLSWKYVEQPFRGGASRFGRRVVFQAAAATMAGWVAFGAFAHLTGGFPGRISPEVLPFALATTDFLPGPVDCETWPADTTQSGFCLIGAAGAAPPSFLVWGDSHAGVLSYGVAAAAEDAGVRGLFAGMGGCPPLVGVDKDESSADAAQDAECVPQNQRALDFLAAHDSIGTVIVISRWAYFASGTGIGRDGGLRVALWPAGTAEPPVPDNDAVFRSGLVETVTRLRALGKRVFLLAQVPEIEQFDVSVAARMLARARAHGIPAELEASSVTPRAEVARRQRAFAELARSLGARDGVTVLETHDFFCDADVCHGVRDQAPLYFDNNHVTITTARALRQVFRPALADARLGAR